MNNNLILTLAYLALFTLSAYFYKKDPKYYAADKLEKSGVTIGHYVFVNL